MPTLPGSLQSAAVKPALLRALRTVQAINQHLRRPPWVPPGHFYSPLASPDDVTRALSWEAEAPGVELRASEQLELARELATLMSDAPLDRYHPGNNMFGQADAAVLYAMLCHLRPRRIIEVGSGFSTAMALDTAERHALDVAITCIEPYPSRVLRLLRPHDKITLIEKPVQDTPVATFANLERNDLLFIDSTHVAKAGSDVLWLFLHVLPRLNPGVVVHVHDVFWPFEYPEPWLREGRNWTESYLLNAFLCHNKSWNILLFSSWLWTNYPHLVPTEMRTSRPGSLWMKRAST